MFEYLPCEKNIVTAEVSNIWRDFFIGKNIFHHKNSLEGSGTKESDEARSRVTEERVTIHFGTWIVATNA